MFGILKYTGYYQQTKHLIFPVFFGVKGYDICGCDKCYEVMVKAMI